MVTVAVDYSTGNEPSPYIIHLSWDYEHHNRLHTGEIEKMLSVLMLSAIHEALMCVHLYRQTTEKKRQTLVARS